MAKDDIERVERDEDMPFEIPPFDENEFVRKELISFRTTLVLFVFSLVIAGITLLIGHYADLPFLILLVFALACAGALPFVYRLARIDVKHFRRREWIGTLFLHFFFWMGFSLLLSNPPIADTSGPVIEGAVTPGTQGIGFPVQLAAYIADNRDLDESSVEFCIHRFASLPDPSADWMLSNLDGCEEVAWNQVPGRPIWTASYQAGQEGMYGVSIRARDAASHTTQAQMLFNVTNPLPVIDPPSGTTFASLSQSLIVRPHEGLARNRDSGDSNLRTVQYQFGGKWYNLTAPSEGQPTYWRTSPTGQGWMRGANELHLRALEQPYYLHGFALEGGIAQSANATRTYTVSNDYPDLNSQEEPRYNERPAPNPLSTPGLGSAALLAALVGVALIAARTRRHE